MADVATARPWDGRARAVLTWLAVLVGGSLSVLTALNQPYNQNEWVQLQPYDSWDPAVVTSGTRQPPLGPLLSALVQHLVGVGQLEQRVVPVLAGIGSLTITALLLRRLDLGWHGVAAVWFLATAPLFLRFSAYGRPYALPLFLMLLCAYAGSRWLDEREPARRRWLAVAVVAAVLLPLARVPEPVVFLASSVAVLALAGWRRRRSRRRAWSLGGALLLALASVGALSTLRLGNESTADGDSLIDLDPGRAWDRLPAGLAELRDFIAPQYAQWFPWWPLTLLAVVLALLLPLSRRLLVRTWWWLPVVLAPLVFLVAYHSVNPFPLDERHYRPRFAYFWLPGLVLVVGAASAAIGRLLRPWAGPLLVVALMVSQLPTTWTVLTENDTNDTAAAARVVVEEVPTDAVVLYDGPSRPGHWRQPFFGSERFFGDADHAPVVEVKQIAAGRGIADRTGPIWLLVLDAPCVDSVACDSPDLPVGPVEGWEVAERFDRYTLYAPAEGQSGRAGAIAALESLAAAYGPEVGALNREAADELREAATE